MTRLWVPPKVEKRLVESRMRDTAEALKMVEMDPLCIQLTAELRDFDEKVSVVKAKDHAHAPNIRPGFYHVMRFNEGAPLSFTPIEARDGGFKVPTSEVLERLRRSDLWNTRVVRDRELVARREAERQARVEEREREERVAEITERWAAASRTQVSLNRDGPWSQNAAGKRGQSR